MSGVTIRLALGALVTVVLLAVPAAAGAVTLRLLPGVTYERETQQTSEGRIVVHSITAPRPGGLYELKPILARDRIRGRERVSDIQKRIAPAATAIGVNGDLFNFGTGHPSGIFFDSGALLSRPIGGRSSLGIGIDGLLQVARIRYFGSIQLGEAKKHPIHDFNRPLEKNAVGLFTSAWASRTPRVPGALDIVLEGFPGAVPNTDLAVTVSRMRKGGGTWIPAGGAVVQATGFWADILGGESAPGLVAVARLVLKPWWENPASALGGGPVIVRDGVAITGAGEEFTSSQLFPRHPRTAVGQLADGRILLAAVDGRQAGSAGVNVPELARVMVKLGAVTAMALDAGGSTTIAFDGRVLNEPSGGAERPVGNALMMLYHGAYVTPPRNPVVSPNGDGFTEFQRLRYRLPRPATITARLTAPDGSVAWQEEGAREPGSYELLLDGREGTPQLVEGRWRFSLSAVDSDGVPSGMDRRFVVDNTLSKLRLSRRSVTLHPRRGTRLRVAFRLSRAAAVRVQLEDRKGRVVRTLAKRRYDEGLRKVVWNGRVRGKKLAKPGRYRVRVIAKGAIARSEIFADVVVRRRPA
ncbi:MAG: phosphodiester glycosidase family protein, partial [Gaiellaceae bacterium]